MEKLTLLKPALVLTACISAGPVLAAGSSAHLSVPPASFLNYHVDTVNELSQEVTVDPAVRGRLANHFHVSEAEMAQYIRRNLVLTHLAKAGYYRVACVGRGGREYWITSRLPAGTAVFASRATGRPILKLACGNPMVSTLPPVEKTAGSQEGYTAPKYAILPPPVAAEAAPMPGLIPGGVSPTDLMVAGTDIAPAVVQVSPSFQGFTNPGAVARGLGSSFGFIPALAGVAALGIASSGRGGGGNNPGPAPEPVPELSTSASLGALFLLGGGAFVLARRKRVQA